MVDKMMISILSLCLSIKFSFVKRNHRNFTSPQFTASFTEVSLYPLYIMAMVDESIFVIKLYRSQQLVGLGRS